VPCTASRPGRRRPRTTSRFTDVLGLLVPGLHMGAGGMVAEVTYVASIGRKHGIVRPDGIDHDPPTGLSGQEVS
jgi:hypothetical protein